MKKITNKALLVIVALFIIATIAIAAVFTHRFNKGALFPDNEQVMPVQPSANANIFLDDASSACTEPDTVTAQP
ncbi:MAG: hypothetical protein LBL18_02165 [Bacteroidales bacterium]|jgi:hypothetical protein|nr:hypothetical protein [Bacteroidales bacterium]